MRLGRKISEGYVVDREAGRHAAAQQEPDQVPATGPELAEWAPVPELPARSGSRED